jgi:hypothetical protein
LTQVTDVTFHQPVNEQVFNDYRQFVVNPMHLDGIEQRIASNEYGTPTAFLADCKWIHHNSYVYNNATHPLTVNARYMLKVARNELLELETCADCFDHYYEDQVNFFRQVCSRPHTLVFAKLEGHPLWPSKVVKIDRKLRHAEVRFFGAHDRASVPFESCFLIPEKFPNWKIPRNQKTKFESAISEFNAHLELLRAKFPDLLQYAPPKTPFNPNQLFLTDPDTPYVPEPKEDEEDKKRKSSLLPQVDTSTPLAKPKRDITKKELTDNDSLNETSKTNQSEFDFTEDSDTPRLEISLISKKSARKRPKPANSSIVTTDTESTPVAKISKLGVNGSSDIKKQTPNDRIKRTLIEDSPTTESAKKKKTKVKKAIEQQINEITVSIVSETNPDSYDDLKDQIRKLKLSVTELTDKHTKELATLKEEHSSELEAANKTAEESVKKQLEDLRNELNAKFDKTSIEIKRKQWCSFCTKEANYFCCWNSSYCSYQCQIKHWPEHLHGCQQNTYSDRPKDAKESGEADKDSPAQDTPKEPSIKEVVKESSKETNKESIEKEPIKAAPASFRNKSRRGDSEKRSLNQDSDQSNSPKKVALDSNKSNGIAEPKPAEAKSPVQTKLTNESKALPPSKNLSELKQQSKTSVKSKEIATLKRGSSRTRHSIVEEERKRCKLTESKAESIKKTIVSVKKIDKNQHSGKPDQKSAKTIVNSQEPDPKLTEAIANLSKDEPKKKVVKESLLESSLSKPDEKLAEAIANLPIPDPKLTEAIANLPKPDSEPIKRLSDLLPQLNSDNVSVPDPESSEAISNLPEPDHESTEAIANLLETDLETNEAISGLTRMNEDDDDDDDDDFIEDNATQEDSQPTIDKSSTIESSSVCLTPIVVPAVSERSSTSIDINRQSMANSADSIDRNDSGNSSEHNQTLVITNSNGTLNGRHSETNGHASGDDDHDDEDIKAEVEQLMSERLDLIEQQFAQT